MLTFFSTGLFAPNNELRLLDATYQAQQRNQQRRRVLGCMFIAYSACKLSVHVYRILGKVDFQSAFSCLRRLSERSIEGPSV